MQDLRIVVQIIKTLDALWRQRLADETRTGFPDIHIAVVTANIKQTHNIADLLRSALCQVGIPSTWYDARLKLCLFRSIDIYFLPLTLVDSPAVHLRGRRLDSYIVDDWQPMPDTVKYAFATCLRRR